MPVSDTNPRTLDLARLARGIPPLVWLVLAVSLFRLVGLFASQLELYPDEAQYWAWSRRFDWGYWSKPPMVAWLIALTTGLGGQAEPWVRLSSVFVHAIAALGIGATADRLYGRLAGGLAALLYLLAPGVALSSGLISTDAALLAFLSLALYCWVRATAGDAAPGPRETYGWAAGFGLCLGLAFLSKYAAVYFLIGAAAHLGLHPAARRRVRPGPLALSMGVFLLTALPNILWNAGHRFATVRHTAANANWNGGLFHPDMGARFVLDQFGAFGPAAFAALLVVATAALRRRRVDERQALLWSFALPPLIIVAIQAFLSRANANWAAAAYPAAVVLVAGWMTQAPRWGRVWMAAAVAPQALISVALVMGAASPGLADALGQANSLKRVRGWRTTTALVLDHAQAARRSGPVSAIAVDDRFLFNEITYYGRDRLAADGFPPLRIWVRGEPGNQAEATAPLTPASGDRVAVALARKGSLPLVAADFARIGPLSSASARLDRKRSRDLVLFIGEGFRPASRPPSARPRRP